MKAHKFPDSKGHFGKFGGKYVIETLMPALQELETNFEPTHDKLEELVTPAGEGGSAAHA